MNRLLEEVKKMVHLVTQAVYFYRKQNYIKGNIYTVGLIKHGDSFFNYAEETGFNESIELLLPVWKELLDASENSNETYLADIYENQLIPALFEIQAFIIGELGGEPLVYWENNMEILKNTDNKLYKILKEARENEKRKYILSWSCTGDSILSVETEQYGQVPLSSSVNPWQEAILYAGVDNSQTGRCIIIGLGMGYHVNYIVSSSYFKEIIILESDLEQLRICMMYTDMKAILSGKKVKIVLCRQAEDYAKWFKEDSKDNSTIYKIWYPSVKTIEDDAIRELLENYWVNTTSSENLGNVMLNNFEDNQKLDDEPVDNIKDKFKNKDIVIVAAGPSLDNSLDYLRKFLNRKDVVIICVGKAAKKLISENIIPGYIVVIDAKKGTRWQTKGIENCGVPLIYLSTAAHSLVSEYNGKRYIAYQECIEPSKEYAEKNNLVLYQSGGSVATFVIDMAIRMECAHVICVGLDMGYIGDNTHAGGIGRKIQNKKSLRKVESVTGREIYTSKTLDIYRRWIERRIENVKDTAFINASGGARIHGMEEKSLKEITEGYCSQIIYCYVQEQKDRLNEFVENHNNDSLIHIYFSVIEECEGKLLYALCDIANKCISQDKMLWFVTDIKELYDIIKQLYSALFEKIIYIEQNNDKEFNSGLEIGKLVSYFLSLQEKFPYYMLMKKLCTLKNSKDINDFTKFLYQLSNAGIENNNKLTNLWICLCELLAYEFRNNDFNKKCSYYNLTVYSILMSITGSANYTNLYLNEILADVNINIENLYFVWQQFKRISIRKGAVLNKKSHELCNSIYEKCYYGFVQTHNKDLKKMPLEERNKNVVILLTPQFLDGTHAPTRSVMERAKVLKELGKTVIIINTTEQYLKEGYIPLYRAHEGTVLDQYNEIKEINIDGEIIPFLQIPSDLPITYRIQVLVHIINKIKPYYILSIGNGSILADLCGNIVPCASMALAFSTIPKTKNKMKLLGRKLSEEEKELYADDDIIESRFTFELEAQKKRFSREEMRLPEDRFILVVVGIRLEFEINDVFMSILSDVCRQGCYVVFAGIIDNFNKLTEEYPVVSSNSSFIGYCDDILALMEICDLYVNPDRLGGGFSIIEAFSKGVPGVYLKSGDVYTAGGEDFAVNDFDGMVEQILKYKDDKDYYNKMSEIAKKRAKLMTSSKEAIADIDRQICQRIEEKYW